MSKKIREGVETKFGPNVWEDYWHAGWSENTTQTNTSGDVAAMKEKMNKLGDLIMGLFCRMEDYDADRDRQGQEIKALRDQVAAHQAKVSSDLKHLTDTDMRREIPELITKMTDLEKTVDGLGQQISKMKEKGSGIEKQASQTSELEKKLRVCDAAISHSLQDIETVKVAQGAQQDKTQHLVECMGKCRASKKLREADSEMQDAIRAQEEPM